MANRTRRTSEPTVLNNLLASRDSAMAKTQRHRIARSRWRTREALWVLFLAAAVTIPSAQAQTYRVLYSFKGTPDGAAPFAGLIQDATGNFYGTTAEGGANRKGTVFKMNAAGKFKVLHTFAGPDGATPFGGLIRDQARSLYGTTLYGGDHDLGTVFKLDPAGHHEVLYSFSGADGAYPQSGLIRDGAGNLYGTTALGGASDFGTVFKLDNAGNHQLLYSFPGGFSGPDGAAPFGGVIRDAAGNLYGTTNSGGLYGWGTVFKLGPSGDFEVLHTFSGSDIGSDGAAPFSDLIRDSAGNLYGTTRDGGQIWGTVFKLDASGNYQVLHRFSEREGGSPDARLVQDAAGILYGTNCGGGAKGWGTVFKLDTAGNYRVLHTLSVPEGICPTGALTRDAAGNFYGTNGDGGAFLRGTVFKLAP